MATMVAVCASLGRTVFLLVPFLLCLVALGFVVASRRWFCWLLCVGYFYNGHYHLCGGLRASLLPLQCRYRQSLCSRPCRRILHLGSLPHRGVRYHLLNPLCCRWSHRLLCPLRAAFRNGSHFIPDWVDVSSCFDL